jgi:hypothetical protein
MLAVVAVVAAVVAAPVYYFQVLGPKRQAAGQRAEARAWTEAWRTARDCVVGTGPGADAFERVLLREVQAGPSITGTCHRQLGALEEAMVGATGNPALDRVWRRINQATRTFVTRARTFGSELHPADKKRTGLAEILAELEELGGELASTAGVEPMPALTTTDLPALPDGLLLHDTRGLPAQLIWWIPDGDASGVRRAAIQQAGGALALTVAAPDGVEVVIVRGPDDIAHVPMPEGTAPATGGPWAAVLGERGGLEIAALDDEGRPVLDGGRVIARGGRDQLMVPLYALGGGGRAVVYGRRGLDPGSAVGDVRILTSADQGRTFTERWRQPPGAAPLIHASWIEPRAYLSYASPEGPAWLPVTESTLATGLVVHPLPLASPLHLTCTGRTGLWLLAERVLYAPAAGGAPVAVEWSLPEGWHRFTCTDDKVAVHVPGPRDARVLRCHRAQGCGTAWKVTAGGPIALHLSDRHGLVAANTVGELLIVWRLEDGTYGRLRPVRTYRAPGMEVVALGEWDGVLHGLVTATGSGDLHLVPLHGTPEDSR